MYRQYLVWQRLPPDSRVNVEIYAKQAENRIGGLTAINLNLDLSVFTTSFTGYRRLSKTPRIAVARLRNRVMSW